MLLLDQVSRFIHICNDLGLDYSISYLYQRKRVQKIFYILRQFGLKFDVSFNWYKHGPYSPELSDIYYQAQDFKTSNFELLERDFQTIEKARPFIEKLKYHNKKLEYYASILFVIKDMIFFDSEKNDSSIEKKIRELKPTLYSHDSYLNALNDFKAFNLI